eukprot:TRINITY_DN2346_c0_g1_i1.p2 TRINITY_DN2346_c0_g1~~TRINITY_DN2346_c0_g1_i1.p2  ORF type:complete len:109 (-),score=7.36 TRINITY_DN2346_c0_g1_i1:595-921(-)
MKKCATAHCHPAPCSCTPPYRPQTALLKTDVPGARLHAGAAAVGWRVTKRQCAGAAAPTRAVLTHHLPLPARRGGTGGSPPLYVRAPVHDMELLADSMMGPSAGVVRP